MKKISLLVIFLLNFFSAYTQLVQTDCTDAIDIYESFLNYEQYKKHVVKQFKIGSVIKIEKNESREGGIKRNFPDSKIQHGPFEVDNWKNSFGKNIITFQNFKFVRQFQEDIIIEVNFIVGLILMPVDSLSNYKVVKICELTSGGGEVVVESVFFANADKDKNDMELAILSSETFKKHGTKYQTFFYKNHLVNNKLKLVGGIFEHCDYIQVKAGKDWDYWLGEEGLPTREIKCFLNSSDKIKNELKIKGY